MNFAVIFVGIIMSMKGVKYHALDKYFPGMKNKYIRTYGNAYDRHGPNNERLLDLWNF